MTTQTKNSLLLMLCSFIWGFAFVAQSSGSGMGAYSFLAGRSWLAVLVLIPTMYVFDALHRRAGAPYGWPKAKKDRKTLLTAGVVCGTFLFLASAAQQMGIILNPSTAKAGFLTAMYVVLVPVFGLALGRRNSARLWVSMVIAVAGLYLLCMKNGFGSMELSDWLLLGCAVLFSFQIMAVDHYSPLVDGVRLSLLEFLVTAIESTLAAFLFETPTLTDFAANSGPERPEPRHRQPHHVSGKRLQRHWRLAHPAPEPLGAGGHRLRADLYRRGAGAAAAGQARRERRLTPWQAERRHRGCGAPAASGMSAPAAR